jgi:hypothetical protein
MAAPFTFPVNLAPVGLNYNMTSANFQRLNGSPENTAWLVSRVMPINDTELNVIFVGNDAHGNPKFRMAGEHPVQRSRVVFNDGSVYIVRNHLGSGTYGIAAEVEEEATGRRYCLKRQDTEDDILPAIKEAIVHYTLYSKTIDPATGESPYVPGFYKMGIHGNIVYYLVEMMVDNLKNAIDSSPNLSEQGQRILYFYNQIVPKLSNLFDMCQYNHGDFKTDNVMYTEAGIYKLIDFGFSRLRIAGRVLETSGFNTFSQESRDLTQMTYCIVKFSTDMANTYRHAMPPFLQAMRTLFYSMILRNGVCDGVDDAHPPHLQDFFSMEWVDTYTWFNSHNNMNGSFRAVGNYLDWLMNRAALGEALDYVPEARAAIDAVAAAAAPAAPPAAHVAVIGPPALPPVPVNAAVNVAPLELSPVLVSPPPVGLLTILQNNSGFIAAGLAIGIAALYDYLRSQGNNMAGGRKKVKHVTRKNRKGRKNYVRKHTSRKFRS